jgi:hypothetical protein
VSAVVAIRTVLLGCVCGIAWSKFGWEVGVVTGVVLAYLDEIACG